MKKLNLNCLNGCSDLLSVLPSDKVLSEKWLSVLIKHSIPFETPNIRYLGVTGLDNAHTFIDKPNRLVFIFDGKDSPLLNEYVIGKCKLEAWEYYNKTAMYPPNTPIDDLFNSTLFRTYREQLTFIVNYMILLEKAMEIE